MQIPEKSPKKPLIDRILTSSFKDYEFLMTMQPHIRKYAAWGYTLLTMVLGILLHFTVRTSLDPSAQEPSIGLVISIYIWAFAISVLVSLVYYFPALRTNRWYQWGYFGFSLLAGVASSYGRLFNRLDGADLLMFLVGTLLLTYGMKYINKAASGIADEKVRLEREKARIEVEIVAAQTMQTMLLPTIRQETTQYHVFGSTQPATEVGGDYFDVVPLSDGKLAVAIGDVSGHNISAGVLMAMTKSAFRTELKHLVGNAVLPNLLQSLNQTVLENTTRRMFVSFECAVFDFAARTLTIANAGHGMVACVRNTSVRIFQPKGTALGLAQKGIFSEEQCDLQPDDIFLFFTDGIVEAMGKYNEEFGTDRIFSAVQAILRKPGQPPSPENIYHAVLNTVQTFTGTSAFADDATLVVLRVV